MPSGAIGRYVLYGISLSKLATPRALPVCGISRGQLPLVTVGNIRRLPRDSQGPPSLSFSRSLSLSRLLSASVFSRRSASAEFYRNCCSCASPRIAGYPSGKVCGKSWHVKTGGNARKRKNWKKAFGNRLIITRRPAGATVRLITEKPASSKLQNLETAILDKYHNSLPVALRSGLFSARGVISRGSRTFFNLATRYVVCRESLRRSGAGGREGRRGSGWNHW